MRNNESKEEYNARMNEYMKARYAKRRADAIELLGGKCSSCSSVEDLEFDHIDRSTKVMSIARLSSASEKRWNEEISKCQLLCKACHLEKTKVDGSTTNYDRITECACGKIFHTVKSFTGHTRWCDPHKAKNIGR